VESTMLYGSVKNNYYDPSCHLRQLNDLSARYSFQLKRAQKWSGLTFLPDGRWKRGALPSNTHRVVLTQLEDFSRKCNYKAYQPEVDEVVFMSRFMASYYDCESNKNLYLGSPKYDVQFDEETVRRKYNVRSDKVALFISPHPLYKTSFNQSEVYKHLKEMGYLVVAKSRRKFSKYCKENGVSYLTKDVYLEDDVWFPHPTLELITMADVVINTDSSVIKECVMLGTPVVNFHLKREDTSGDRRVPGYMNYLSDGYDYHRTLNENAAKEEFQDAVKDVTADDYAEQFEDAREKFLSNRSNVSEALLDHLGR